MWSHRLAVRTPGFHPGNRGSIPLGITSHYFRQEKFQNLFSGTFLFVLPLLNRVRFALGACHSLPQCILKNMDTYHIAINKEASIRLSAYGLILVFVAAGLFKQFTGGGGSDGNALLMLFAALVAIAVHELAHGVFFKLFGGRVRYGVGMKYYLLPYAYATSRGTAFSFGQMMTIGLAPFVLLSTLLIGLTVAMPSLAAYWSIAFIINFGGAVGDLWLMSRIWKFRRIPGVKFIDEADGIQVKAESSEVSRIATKFTQKKTAFVASLLNAWMLGALVLLIQTILVSGVWRALAPQQSFIIGTDQFFLAKYVTDTHGTTATLELMPIIVGGFIFALLFSWLQSKKSGLIPGSKAHSAG